MIVDEKRKIEYFKESFKEYVNIAIMNYIRYEERAIKKAGFDLYVKIDEYVEKHWENVYEDYKKETPVSPMEIIAKIEESKIREDIGILGYNEIIEKKTKEKVIKLLAKKGITEDEIEKQYEDIKSLADLVFIDFLTDDNFIQSVEKYFNVNELSQGEFEKKLFKLTDDEFTSQCGWYYGYDWVEEKIKLKIHDDLDGLYSAYLSFVDAGGYVYRGDGGWHHDDLGYFFRQWVKPNVEKWLEVTNQKERAEMAEVMPTLVKRYLNYLRYNKKPRTFIVNRMNADLDLKKQAEGREVNPDDHVRDINLQGLTAESLGFGLDYWQEAFKSNDVIKFVGTEKITAKSLVATPNKDLDMIILKISNRSEISRNLEKEILKNCKKIK
ncbi:hypothetical protein SY212_04720 [Ligilactobacillus agilis]|uniref:Uncharacterized protein n=1 Tax=Ligilactobacillus agilis TaxID=1601 RepID=A0A6F9XJK8_9LACO|nr:hypothetical protein [Ligilactobacillus agilis]GET05442.1 hypothetical protein SY212_04720 [Ligilactobacillus agilis]